MPGPSDALHPHQLNGLPTDNPTAPLLASTPVHAGARAHGACPRSRGSLEKLQDLPEQPKRRGRPPTKFFKQIEQKYLTQLTEQPVPPGESPAQPRGPWGRGCPCPQWGAERCGAALQRCRAAGGGCRTPRSWRRWLARCTRGASGRRRCTSTSPSTRSSCGRSACAPPRVRAAHAGRGGGADACSPTESTLRPQTPSSTYAPRRPVPPCLRKPWPSGR